MPKRALINIEEAKRLQGRAPTADEPTYRFHGHKPPKRIVNQLVEPDVEAGVATMRLYDPIDSWGGEWGVSAKEFTAALDGLPDGVSEIRLHINSPGGEVFEGIAILNALRNHDAKISAYVDGIAASAASFVAAGCDELVMGKNSELMIHDAQGVCIGNAAEMTTLADLLNHLSDNIASIYAEKAGGDLADWRATMTGQKWYSAEDAVTAGLADRIEGDPKPTNTFDLSAVTATVTPPDADGREPDAASDSADSAEEAAAQAAAASAEAAEEEKELILARLTVNENAARFAFGG